MQLRGAWGGWQGLAAGLGEQQACLGLVKCRTEQTATCLSGQHTGTSRLAGSPCRPAKATAW